MGKSVAIPHLLARLMEIPGKERHSRDSQRLIHAKNTDYCQECKNIIEDQCMRHGDYRWHIACFKCFKCACPLKIDSTTMINVQLHCLSCVNASPYSFSYVSKLTQYSYLLRVALSRLCNLLQVTGIKGGCRLFSFWFFIFLSRFPTIKCGLLYQVKSY